MCNVSVLPCGRNPAVLYRPTLRSSSSLHAGQHLPGQDGFSAEHPTLPPLPPAGTRTPPAAHTGAKEKITVQSLDVSSIFS